MRRSAPVSSARAAGVLTALLLGAAATASAAPVRVKELVDVQGVRENALYGYGLVVGLAGTGDSERVFFTSQSISGMLGRLGIRIDPARRARAQRRRGHGDRAAALLLPPGHPHRRQRQLAGQRPLAGGRASCWSRR